MSEVVYYEDPLVHVTSYGVKSRKGTLPLSDLRAIHVTSTRWMNYLMIAVGSPLLLMGLDSVLVHQDYAHLITVTIWSILISFQIYGLMKRKHIFSLNLETAHGNKNILSSANESYVQKVADAVRKAQANWVHPLLPYQEQIHYRDEM